MHAGEIMDLIEQLLSDAEIVDAYNEIDSKNKTMSSHGMNHVRGALLIATEIGKLLSFSEREMLLLQVAEVLHDIGQVEGRENHQHKAAVFAEKYLEKFNEFSKEEIDLICSAIETHDDFKTHERLNSRVAWVVNVADKLDFSKTRLDSTYLERFEYSNSEDIEKLDFYLENNVFKIVIRLIPNPKVITAESLLNRNLMCKAFTNFKAFCENFGFVPEVWMEDEKLDLNKINAGCMIDR